MGSPPLKNCDGRTCTRSGPIQRRAIAEGLHAFVLAAAPLIGKVDIGGPPIMRPAGSPLWFEPHDVRFDFESTSAGAQWIDSLAVLARDRLEDVDADSGDRAFRLAC